MLPGQNLSRKPDLRPGATSPERAWGAEAENGHGGGAGLGGGGRKRPRGAEAENGLGDGFWEQHQHVIQVVLEWIYGHGSTISCKYPNVKSDSFSHTQSCHGPVAVFMVQSSMMYGAAALRFFDVDEGDGLGGRRPKTILGSLRPASNL